MRLQPGPSEAHGRTHRDAEYGHQPGEINFWFPLSDASLTKTTLHVESVPDLGDFHPLGQRASERAVEIDPLDCAAKYSAKGVFEDEDQELLHHGQDVDFASSMLDAGQRAVEIDPLDCTSKHSAKQIFDDEKQVKHQVTDMVISTSTSDSTSHSKPHQTECLTYGAIGSFHGALCRHHAPPNMSSFTRASIDFRVGVGRYFDVTWKLQGVKAQHSWKEWKVEDK
jgi:hypothetical protein